ncbi:MAG TPA: 3-dehydroquinate synthase [Terriglobales bacterium]|nr:3-dehydroquinate synthase [Terriglobales bacterium]
MKRVTITVPQRSYEAIIENGLLERAGQELRKLLPDRKQLFVVTVLPVKRRWGKKLHSSVAAAGFDAKFVEMPDGERHKRLATVEVLGEELVRQRAERDAVIVAFGGGVVGDVAGLLASIYMRGVEVIQIPTTVLAQVDASIGGKTGVNLRAGKNLLGTFQQPLAVLIDPAVLSTLPEREFRAGLYESVKCGVIGNVELFRVLEDLSVKDLRRDPTKLEWVIGESVKLKADVVSRDEREGGLRRVLNFGHTIGHALEAATAYRRYLHGEAVAWGMVAAADIAARTGKCGPEISQRIADATLRLGALPKVESEGKTILRLLKTDKKTRDGVVHFVLPRQIGRVEIDNDVSEQAVIEAVSELRRRSTAKRPRG